MILIGSEEGVCELVEQQSWCTLRAHICIKSSAMFRSMGSVMLLVHSGLPRIWPVMARPSGNTRIGIKRTDTLQDLLDLLDLPSQTMIRMHSLLCAAFIQLSQLMWFLCECLQVPSVTWDHGHYNDVTPAWFHGFLWMLSQTCYCWLSGHRGPRFEGMPDVAWCLWLLWSSVSDDKS